MFRKCVSLEYLGNATAKAKKLPKKTRKWLRGPLKTEALTGKIAEFVFQFKFHIISFMLHLPNQV